MRFRRVVALRGQWVKLSVCMSQCSGNSKSSKSDGLEQGTLLTVVPIADAACIVFCEQCRETCTSTQFST